MSHHGIDCGIIFIYLFSPLFLPYVSIYLPICQPTYLYYYYYLACTCTSPPFFRSLARRGVNGAACSTICNASLAFLTPMSYFEVPLVRCRAYLSHFLVLLSPVSPPSTDTVDRQASRGWAWHGIHYMSGQLGKCCVAQEAWNMYVVHLASRSSGLRM